MAPKRIMVVDDSRSLRELVAATLVGAGYEVVQAENGKEAIARLLEQRVHLVLCDVNMPVMDGLSFVRELRQLAGQRFLPVLMLTTESGEELKLQGQIAGAKAWLVKPFRPPQLLQAVSRLVMS